MQRENEEIKKLIQSGFDLDLISFELDIPIEQVRQCKRELEITKITRRYPKKNIEEVNDVSTEYKISKIREKYRELYSRNNTPEVKKAPTLSQEQNELIQKVILVVEEKVEKIKSVSKKERKYVASGIITELRKLETCQLTIVQAEQLYKLISFEELKDLNTSIVDRVDYYMGLQRRRIANNFARAIDYEQSQINDIGELQILERKITRQMIDDDPMFTESIKRKISSRIMEIQRQQAVEKIKNDIPTTIIQIIENLVNGNIDIQKANEIIEEEVRKREKNKVKTVFSLTEEQEKRQILRQIKMALTENPDRFPIKNPEMAVLQIKELCGEGEESAIRVVTKNLIERKDFETAKRICDKYYEESKTGEKESEFTKYMSVLRNEIRNSEIGDIIIKLIKMNGSPEEETACFELIEKGLKKGNINLRAISLGKSSDGVKNITLEDIWYNEKQKSKTR